MLEKIYKRFNKIKNRFFNYAWFHSPSGLVNHRKLLKLHNKFEGKRCFVMGNGPSLLKCDLTLLKNEITIASNAQYLIWDKMGFIPTFLTVEDRLVAEDRMKELNNIKGVAKIFPKDLSKFLKIDNDTSYINFSRDYPDFPKFSSEFDKVVYWGGTVSFLNLQLAYYLGCNEIYMIGFDHEYKVNENIDKDNVITSDKEDVNHIHPQYFGKGYRWHDPNVNRMEVGYVEAKNFIESKGIKIYNATVGGKLEVFERIEYSSLFLNKISS